MSADGVGVRLWRQEPQGAGTEGYYAGWQGNTGVDDSHCRM